MKPGQCCLLPSAFCLATLAAAPAVAQDAWPSRPVRLVVPSSPGGATDTYARLLAQGLGDALKRQFIVDNRPGASGNVGAEIAARSAPDRYTFLVASSASLSVKLWMSAVGSSRACKPGRASAGPINTMLDDTGRLLYHGTARDSVAGPALRAGIIFRCRITRSPCGVRA